MNKNRFRLNLKQIPIFIALAFGGLNQVQQVQANEIPYQSDWLKGHYLSRTHNFGLQPINKGDIVFIGDSITEQGMNWGLRFNDFRIRNRGISGDMTYGVLARLDELKENEPKAIFIMIGINDIFNLYYEKQVPSLASVSQNIGKITRELASALPNTKIYVQSLLPDYRDFITAMAGRVNQQIQQIENKPFTYIDLHTVFKGKDGTINPELSTDGTHLNQAGYELWRKQLNSVIKTL